jgi:Zn-dependent M28 family amino/carboxypeptidase
MGRKQRGTIGTKELKYAVFTASVVAVLASVPLLATRPKATIAMNAERIRAHVKYLASDELQGRGMGQKGSDLAADYIGKEFESYGLKPAGDSGTYFQNVPMVGVKTLPQTTFEVQRDGGETVSLKNLDDFVTNNESQTETADFSAPIVFVGFGIKAPEYNWDDYKNYDLHGKVALLFVSEPVSDDRKFFKGKALTYYGRWTYKYEETARRGAIATLIIHRTDLASYGWEVVRNSMGTERSYLKRDGTPKLEAASWVQLETAKKIVAAGGSDLDKLYQQAQSHDFRPVELPVKLKAHVVSELHSFLSRNVVAKIEGHDEKRKDEAILYTAHYDHLGINPALKGDNIYNGAVDNATGCGIVLELARVAASNAASGAQVPERSVYFAAVTAEEQGLLGSEYFGKHPPVPAGRISLDLNFDALPPVGVPEEVEVSGSERTTFYPTVESIAKSSRLAIRPDSRPEAGHYYRSDHFSLARVAFLRFRSARGRSSKGTWRPGARPKRRTM